MNFAIFSDIAAFSPYVNRCFGRKYHFHFQGRKRNQETSLQQVDRQNLRSHLPGDAFLRNVRSRKDYTALYSRKWQQ
jgi:hypothetical protein